MKAARLAITAVLGVMIVFSAATLFASDPVGIYAIVAKVVFEPSEAAPQRIQIWGVFSLAETTRGGSIYSKPQEGYLYYSLPAGKEAIAQKEWADLKTVAGTGQGIGFGARYSPLGKVRPASEKPTSADAYGISSVGVARINPIVGYQDSMNDVVAQLKAALKKS